MAHSQAQLQPQQQPSAAASAAPAPGQPPMMFNEAPLPLAWPPVGAVGEIVLKRYPAYRGARVVAAGPNAGATDQSGALFRALFDHIRQRNIRMTAPVEQIYRPEGGESVAMTFLYGEPGWGAAGPDSRDPRVVVVDMPPQTVASVAFRGSYSRRNVEEACVRIRQWVDAYRAPAPAPQQQQLQAVPPAGGAADAAGAGSAAAGGGNAGCATAGAGAGATCLEICGPPRMLSYNSPFVPWFLRISEVQLPVREVPAALDEPAAATAALTSALAETTLAEKTTQEAEAAAPEAEAGTGAAGGASEPVPAPMEQ